eukprot:TRINITY_DN6432_c0_g1_i2.p1 TRINITY_DN6432_c0_g1~~TRINITY_DN6432_c0_g1_i2.p1  ORF type:complete len:479 (+),score=95.77 TRINITY_DN6432_c0_g1_i2:36-1472(+)
MLEKRSLDITAATSAAKRAKLGEQPIGGPRKISLDSIKENLAKKKRELAEIQQKIFKKKDASKENVETSAQDNGSKVSVFQAAAQAAARLGNQVGMVAQENQTGEKPVPLRVDDRGREIDEKGNLIDEGKKPATFPQVQPLRAESFIDPNIMAKSSRRKAKHQLEFIVEGRLHREAQIFKLKQKYGEHHWKHHFFKMKRKEEQERQRAVEIEEAERAEDDEEDEELKPQPVPEIEWWDAKLLPAGAESYEQNPDGKFQFKESMLTNLVEHPVPIEPPIDDEPPPIQPLKLTSKEIKKLRHQRRIEREKQRQEMIQRGLIEPPKPKVKLTNLFRVLGEQSTADPTQIEAEVRKQMAEREQAHNDRNIARKLTPMERKEKKMKKLFNLEQQEVQVAVFRVDFIPQGQNRTIVGKNAGYNEFTGVQIIVEGSMSIVIVEGEAKGIERFKKLMLNRINWQVRSESTRLNSSHITRSRMPSSA